MDLTGMKFNRLLVIKKAYTKVYDNGQKVNLWECLCDCGNTAIVREQGLTSGRTKSCGCFRKEKISSLKAKYVTDIDKELIIRYKGVIQRCYDRNADNYKYYGGRGIKVCDEWLDDFYKFRDWAVANGYSKELTLDRIDFNGDYCPENCRWVTWAVQQNNKSSNHIIECDGMKMTIADVARYTGEAYSKVRSRVSRSQK